MQSVLYHNALQEIISCNTQFSIALLMVAFNIGSPDHALINVIQEGKSGSGTETFLSDILYA